MKYVDEFRDRALARDLACALKREVDPARTYAFMEFCGGHTHAISRSGLVDLLPDNLRLIHGPGCPVCVLPVGRIDTAIDLVRSNPVILCTYGDCLRVPASGGESLLRVRGHLDPQTSDVKMVYSISDALDLARQWPDRQVVFLAIGFETTTPPTAVALKQARRDDIENFSVLCNHVLTPAAMGAILDNTDGANRGPDGIIGPAHVSTIIGTAPYDLVARRYYRPVVVAGFEPLDILQALRMLVRQVNEGRAEVENEFTRAVCRDGNRKAKDLMAEVFCVRDAFEWRGLGTLPQSALTLGDDYAVFDADQRYGLVYRAVPDHKGCECGAILQGLKAPEDCRIFGSVCTPSSPVGSCMVSSEGACAAHYTYGRFRKRKGTPAPEGPMGQGGL